MVEVMGLEPTIDRLKVGCLYSLKLHLNYLDASDSTDLPDLRDMSPVRHLFSILAINSL
ncbi:hypothetical protein SIPHO039v1_p0086 [Vibrio phage 70E35.5a]|nr:hypothetical protein SIPHO036v1_110009 [Vibrio phage 70E38.1]QZI88715.1 hypothetical protein SIPHO039v1_p0086 [Vibrio phage 70E35.5a]